MTLKSPGIIQFVIPHSSIYIILLAKAEHLYTYTPCFFSIEKLKLFTFYLIRSIREMQSLIFKLTGMIFLFLFHFFGARLKLKNICNLTILSDNVNGLGDKINVQNC